MQMAWVLPGSEREAGQRHGVGIDGVGTCLGVVVTTAPTRVIIVQHRHCLLLSRFVGAEGPGRVLVK